MGYCTKLKLELDNINHNWEAILINRPPKERIAVFCSPNGFWKFNVDGAARGKAKVGIGGVL